MAKFDENLSKANRVAANKAEINKLETQAKTDTYAKHLNAQKSWEKLDKKIPHIQKLADEIEQAGKNLVKALNELDVAILDAYHTAPEVDASLAISPLGAGKVWHYCKVHLMKNGLKNLGSLQNRDTLKSFKENITEGLLWLVKLRSGDQLHGTIKQRNEQLAAKRSNGQ